MVRDVFRALSQKKTLPFGDVSCALSQKKTLPFGDVFLLGCPDGLEPSTFRTTSKLSNLSESLCLSAFQRFRF